jgi:hypothetical protein
MSGCHCPASGHHTDARISRLLTVGLNYRSPMWAQRKAELF